MIQSSISINYTCIENEMFYIEILMKIEREILCYDYNINLLTVLQCRIINRYKFLCVWSDLSLYPLFISTLISLLLLIYVYYCLQTFDLIFIFILLHFVVTCYSLLTIMKTIETSFFSFYIFHFISGFIYSLSDIYCPILIFFMFFL